MNNTSKYDLVSNIIAFIQAPDYIATITNLAADCNVPIPYMREAIISILNNRILSNSLYDEADYDEEDSIKDLIIEDPASTKEAIRAGEFDDTIWQLDLNILTYDENNILALSPLEYGSLNTFGEDILSIRQGALFEKKETTNPLSDRDRKNQQELIMAKENQRMVSFNYKDKDGKSKNVKCFPVDVFVNVTDNWIYMRSSEGKLYRLDRITHNVRAEKTTTNIPKYTANPNLKYIWGTYFDEKSKPEHVKIRIAPETNNIMNKIKNDLRFRSNAETYLFYQEGNYFYYEDDIIGLAEFQRWVRGYGSSIVVLEPASMRAEIVTRAKETLENYKASLDWEIQ